MQFELPEAARVTAWIEGDLEGQVDIDIHLLEDLTIGADNTATGCVARANTIAEAQMSVGTHYAVVDTYDGDARVGDFVLRLFAVGSDRSEIPTGEGVVWSARRSSDGNGGQVTDEQAPLGGLALLLLLGLRRRRQLG